MYEYRLRMIHKTTGSEQWVIFYGDTIELAIEARNTWVVSQSDWIITANVLIKKVTNEK